MQTPITPSLLISLSCPRRQLSYQSLSGGLFRLQRLYSCLGDWVSGKPGALFGRTTSYGGLDNSTEATRSLPLLSGSQVLSPLPAPQHFKIVKIKTCYRSEDRGYLYMFVCACGLSCFSGEYTVILKQNNMHLQTSNKNSSNSRSYYKLSQTLIYIILLFISTFLFCAAVLQTKRPKAACKWLKEVGLISNVPPSSNVFVRVSTCKLHRQVLSVLCIHLNNYFDQRIMIFPNCHLSD